MKLLDEAEKDIIEDANRERDEIIEMEPLLEKLKFDFNSDIPLEEQKAAGMKFLHEHCQEFLKTAKAERREKVKAEKEAQLARLKAEEKARRRRDEQKAAAAETRRLEKELEVSCSQSASPTTLTTQITNSFSFANS